MTQELTVSLAETLADLIQIRIHRQPGGFFRVASRSIRVDCWPLVQRCFIHGHKDPIRNGDLVDAVRLAVALPEMLPKGQRVERLHYREWSKIRETIKEAFTTPSGEMLCHMCRMPIWDDWTVDHVIPLCRGGTNEIENLAPCHDDCNDVRGSEMLELRRQEKRLWQELERLAPERVMGRTVA